MAESAAGVLSTLTGKGSKFASSLIASALSFVSVREGNSTKEKITDKNVDDSGGEIITEYISPAGSCVDELPTVHIDNGHNTSCIEGGSKLILQQLDKKLILPREKEQEFVEEVVEKVEVKPLPPENPPAQGGMQPISQSMAPIPPFPCSEQALLSHRSSLSLPTNKNKEKCDFNRAKLKERSQDECENRNKNESINVTKSSGNRLKKALEVPNEEYTNKPFPDCGSNVEKSNISSENLKQDYAKLEGSQGGGSMYRPSRAKTQYQLCNDGSERALNATERDKDYFVGPRERRPSYSNNRKNDKQSTGDIEGTKKYTGNEGFRNRVRPVNDACGENNSEAMQVNSAKYPMTSVELIEKIIGIQRNSAEWSKDTNLEARATLYRALHARQLDVARSVYDGLMIDGVEIIATNYVLLVQIALSQKDTKWSSIWLLELLRHHKNVDAAWVDRVLAATAVASDGETYCNLLKQLDRPEISKNMNSRLKGVISNAAVYLQTANKNKVDTNAESSYSQNSGSRMDGCTAKKCPNWKPDHAGLSTPPKALLDDSNAFPKLGASIYEPRRRRALTLREQALVVEEAMKLKESEMYSKNVQLICPSHISNTKAEPTHIQNERNDNMVQKLQDDIEEALQTEFQGLLNRRELLQKQQEELNKLNFSEKEPERSLNPNAPAFVPGVATNLGVSHHDELANLQRKLALQRRTQKLLEEQLELEEKVQEHQEKMSKIMAQRKNHRPQQISASTSNVKSGMSPRHNGEAQNKINVDRSNMNWTSHTMPVGMEFQALSSVSHSQHKLQETTLKEQTNNSKNIYGMDLSNINSYNGGLPRQRGFQDFSICDAKVNKKFLQMNGPPTNVSSTRFQPNKKNNHQSSLKPWGEDSTN